MPQNAPPYRITKKTIPVPPATTVALTLPNNSKEHLLRMDGSLGFKWSTDRDEVDAGGGFPLISGEALTFSEAVAQTEIYVRHADAGTVDLHWAYSFLARR